MDADITPILRNWPFEPGKLSARKILGHDGRPRIQLRLDLGVLQMETEGRPDGQRPHGFESLLAFHQDRLRRHRLQGQDEEDFALGAPECEALRSEAVMYYHRYIGEFVLQDYEAVERDTARNLEVVEFCSRYAQRERDRLALEQSRPYILMMNARAKAIRALDQQQFQAAREAATAGLESIREFLARFGQSQEFDSAGEVVVLQALLAEIERREPDDPIRSLEKKLAQAIEAERYEEAARLRDELRQQQGGPGQDDA